MPSYKLYQALYSHTHTHTRTHAPIHTHARTHAHTNALTHTHARTHAHTNSPPHLTTAVIPQTTHTINIHSTRSDHAICSYEALITAGTVDKHVPPL